ncbi:hypothetical protein U9M48_005279 [Paspalum notatum var. saurae]|uniref:Uncharacterized protein n=1 Tax=Paspalum notatum var. saurae TaxID=547442 RepID=A0AAQ3PLZ9_PASNO
MPCASPGAVKSRQNPLSTIASSSSPLLVAGELVVVVGSRVRADCKLSTHSPHVAVPRYATTTSRRPSRAISASSSHTATYPIHPGTDADAAWRRRVTRYPVAGSPARHSREPLGNRHDPYDGARPSSQSKLAYAARTNSPYRTSSPRSAPSSGLSRPSQSRAPWSSGHFRPIVRSVEGFLDAGAHGAKELLATPPWPLLLRPPVATLG